MRWRLVLDLKVIKSFPRIQGICVVESSRIRRRLLLRGAIVAALRVIVRIVILIVDEALFLKEILAAGIPCLINLGLLLVKGVVLDIDLTLAAHTAKVLLHHSDEAQKLRAFYLLGVKVVCFRYVEVRDHIVCRLVEQHLFVNQDVVVKLLVLLLLEVVDDCELGWVVLYHQLRGH